MKPRLAYRLRYLRASERRALIRRLVLAVECGVLEPREAERSFQRELLPLQDFALWLFARPCSGSDMVDAVWAAKERWAREYVYWRSLPLE